MASCSVCGDDERFLNTCNKCGKKHCPEHQLPENHVCIPRKSDMVDADESDRWFSEKHERSNVMADERRGERELIDDPDPHLEETETKRPLEEDEVNADTSSSPHDWVRDVQRNREELNRRLQDRQRTGSSENPDAPDEETSSSSSSHPASQRDYSASTPPSPVTGPSSSESTSDTPSRLPSAAWVLVLLALVVVAYVAIGAI